MDYDQVIEMMRSRRSVRKFTDRQVSRVDIERLVEPARWAPSNHNRQGWKFVVFEDRAELDALSGRIAAVLGERLKTVKSIPQAQADQLVEYATLFARAPVAILVMHKRCIALGRGHLAGVEHGDLVSGEPLSAAMAVQNMLLSAHCMGLGACVLTAPLLAGEVWKNLDDLPAGFEPTCLVAIGYADGEPSAPKRKPIEQIIEYR